MSGPKLWHSNEVFVLMANSRHLVFGSNVINRGVHAAYENDVGILVCGGLFNEDTKITFAEFKDNCTGKSQEIPAIRNFRGDILMVNVNGSNLKWMYASGFQERNVAVCGYLLVTGDVYGTAMMAMDIAARDPALKEVRKRPIVDDFKALFESADIRPAWYATSHMREGLWSMPTATKI